MIKRWSKVFTRFSIYDILFMTQNEKNMKDTQKAIKYGMCGLSVFCIYWLLIIRIVIVSS